MRIIFGWKQRNGLAGSIPYNLSICPSIGHRVSITGIRYVVTDVLWCTESLPEPLIRLTLEEVTDGCDN